MNFASSSSAFFGQSLSLLSAQPLQTHSAQSTSALKGASGSSATDAFADVFARTQSNERAVTNSPAPNDAPLRDRTDPATTAPSGADQPPPKPDDSTPQPASQADQAARDQPNPRQARTHSDPAVRNRSQTRTSRPSEEPTDKTSDRSVKDDDKDSKISATTDEAGEETTIESASKKDEDKTIVANALDLASLKDVAFDSAEASQVVAVATTLVTIAVGSAKAALASLPGTGEVASAAGGTLPVSGDGKGLPDAGKTPDTLQDLANGSAHLFLKLAGQTAAGETASGDEAGKTEIAANDGKPRSLSPVPAPNALPDGLANLIGAAQGKTGVSSPSTETSTSALETGLKALGAALKASAGSVAPASSIVLPQALAGLAADAPKAAPDQGPVTTLSTTLAAIPVAIGSRALNGVREFTIHLYPAELGKVEVKLAIGDNGDIRANLTVDRVETLQLLQRDAPSLHQALEQAGFKPPENGVQVSLRQDAQQNFHQRQTSDEGRRQSGRQASENDSAIRDVTLQALAVYQRRGTGALDIHI